MRVLIKHKKVEVKAGPDPMEGVPHTAPIINRWFGKSVIIRRYRYISDIQYLYILRATLVNHEKYPGSTASVLV